MGLLYRRLLTIAMLALFVTSSITLATLESGVLEDNCAPQLVGGLMNTAEPTSNLSIPYVDEHYGAPDGIIDPTEYAFSYTDPSSGITIYLEHNSTKLFVGLSARTTGWVALGWKNPEESYTYDGLNNSDLIFGYSPEGSYESFKRVTPFDSVTVDYVLKSRNGTVLDEGTLPKDDSDTPISEEALLQGYKDQIMGKDDLPGMRIGEVRHFMIPAEEAYNEPEHPLYGEDLWFTITLTRINNDFDNPAESSAIAYSDEYGTSTFLHSPDANQSRIVAANGTNDGTNIQLEYILRMNSTGPFDIPLLNSTDIYYPFVLLSGDQGDFSTLPVMHTDWSQPLMTRFVPNTPPVLEIHKPEMNQTLRWITDLELNASDNTIVTQAYYRIGDENWTEMQYDFMTKLWRRSIDLSDYENGPHQIWFNATDASNSSRVAYVNITVDNPFMPLQGMGLSVSRTVSTMMYHQVRTTDEFSLTNRRAAPIGAIEINLPLEYAGNFLAISSEDANGRALEVVRLANQSGMMRWRVSFFEPVRINGQYSFKVIMHYQGLQKVNTLSQNLYDLIFLRFPVVPYVLSSASFSFGFRTGDSLASPNIEGRLTNIAPMTVEVFNVTIKSFTPVVVANIMTEIAIDPWGWLHYKEIITVENIGNTKDTAFYLTFPAYTSNIRVYDRVGILASSIPKQWEWNETVRQRIDLPSDRFGPGGFLAGYKYTFTVQYAVRLQSYESSTVMGSRIDFPLSKIDDMRVQKRTIDVILPLSLGVVDAGDDYRLLYQAYGTTLRYNYFNTTNVNTPELQLVYNVALGIAIRPFLFAFIIGLIAVVYVAYRKMGELPVSGERSREEGTSVAPRQKGAPPELLSEFATVYSKKTSLGLDLEKLESSRKRGKVTQKEYMIRERDIKSQLDELDSRLGTLKQEMISQGSRYRDMVSQLEFQEEKIAGAKAGLRQLLLRRKKQRISRAAFEKSRQDYLKTIKQAITTTDRILLTLQEEAGDI